MCTTGYPSVCVWPLSELGCTRTASILVALCVSLHCLGLSGECITEHQQRLHSCCLGAWVLLCLCQQANSTTMAGSAVKPCCVLAAPLSSPGQRWPEPPARPALALTQKVPATPGTARPALGTLAAALRGFDNLAWTCLCPATSRSLRMCNDVCLGSTQVQQVCVIVVRQVQVVLPGGDTATWEARVPDAPVGVWPSVACVLCTPVTQN